MGDHKLTTIVSILPIFANKNLSPSNPDRYKILLTESKGVIQENMTYYTSLDIQLREMYNRYVSISFEWPVKRLSGCRKDGATLEVTYSFCTPMIEAAVRRGTLVNIKEFFELGMDTYYGTIISRNG